MATRKNVLKRHMARAINHLDNCGTQLTIISETVKEYPEHYHKFIDLLTGVYLMREVFVNVWKELWGVVPEDFSSYL